jgi:DNA-binding transcriptional regulator YhcF (GntR family)
MFIDLNTQKVAREIFLKPTSERSLRELAKITGLSTATVSKMCRQLESNGIIKTRLVAKSRLVSASLESEDYLFFKRINNILLLKPVIDRLNANHPSAIILYGSYAKGSDTEESDIDMAVIGSKTDVNFNKYEKELNRKMHLIFFPSEKQIPNNLKQNLLNGIMLKGGMLC